VCESDKVLYVETATGDRLPCNRQVELSATSVISSAVGLELRPIHTNPFDFLMHGIDLVIGVLDIHISINSYVAVPNHLPNNGSICGGADWNSNSQAQYNQHQLGLYHQTPQDISQEPLSLENSVVDLYGQVPFLPNVQLVTELLVSIFLFWVSFAETWMTSLSMQRPKRNWFSTQYSRDLI
jgi:hypothetical protein